MISSENKIILQYSSFCKEKELKRKLYFQRVKYIFYTDPFYLPRYYRNNMEMFASESIIK